MMYLIRGLSGSGKTALGYKMRSKSKPRGGLDVISADDYFIMKGVYRFEPARLADAHEACQDSARWFAEKGLSFVVANTFSTRWELEPYLKLAAKYFTGVTVIDLFDGGLTDEELDERNVHDVPLKTIRAMRARWEHDWRSGNPLPPWER